MEASDETYRQYLHQRTPHILSGLSFFPAVEVHRKTNNNFFSLLSPLCGQLASDGLAAKWLKMKLGEQPTAAGGTAEEEAKTTDPQKNVAAHEGPKKEEGAEEEEEEMHPEGDQRTEL